MTAALINPDQKIALEVDGIRLEVPADPRLYVGPNQQLAPLYVFVSSFLAVNERLLRLERIVAEMFPPNDPTRYLVASNAEQLKKDLTSLAAHVSGASNAGSPTGGPGGEPRNTSEKSNGNKQNH